MSYLYLTIYTYKLLLAIQWDQYTKVGLYLHIRGGDRHLFLIAWVVG